MTYEMDIAGLKRELPLCKVTDDLYIGAFVMFGDVELTVHCAAKGHSSSLRNGASERRGEIFSRQKRPQGLHERGI